MTTAIIIFSLVSLSLTAQSTENLTDAELFNPPTTPNGGQIPKEYIPVYYCLDSFFTLPVSVHIKHDSLDELLEEVGVTPTLILKAHVIQISARTSDKSDRFDSMKQYEDNATEWDREQYRLIAKEIKAFKALYDAFLTACEDEGLDPDAIHENIVEFGRDITAIGTSGEFDPRHKAALRIFEEAGTSNPWLE